MAPVKKRLERSAKKVNPPKVSFPKLEAGDYVRLVILRKSKIDKIYQQWSDEVFEVSSARKDNTYKVRNIGGREDGQVRKFVYQRDYLKEVPTETGDHAKKDAEQESKKEEEDREQQEKEDEEMRQLQAQRRRERETLQYGFDQWQDFFAKNKDFTFRINKDKYKVHSVFRLTRTEKKSVSVSEGRNKIWIAFYEEKERRPRSRQETSKDKVLTTNFVKETLLLQNYRVNHEK